MITARRSRWRRRGWPADRAAGRAGGGLGEGAAGDGAAALRGVDLVSAATLVAEVGDFRRFASASELMSFVGLVPSEHSSGGSRRQGRITRTGNGHVRRILVESTWHYRRQPRMSQAIRARN